MRCRQPDRPLRRAVMELARLHPEDLAMILDALEPPERARIDVLIGELGGGSATHGVPVPAPDAEPVWTWQGVSPWLRVRIDPDARTGRSNPEFVLITDAARAALVAAAEPFRVSPDEAGQGRSLMGIIRDRLSEVLA